MRVGFLGTGVIAACMVRGLARQGHEISVSHRNTGISGKLTAEVEGVVALENAEVVRRSDAVFLCLMADTAREVLGDLAFRPEQQVISVMADLPLAELKVLCAPASQIAITIPLSAIATGGSMLPVFPASSALNALYGDRNHILQVASERSLNAHFGGSALSAPLLALMQTGADWLAAQTGDKKAAEIYVAGVFAGFLKEMLSQKSSFQSVLDSLATEGGLNASLKGHVEAKGGHADLIEGLDALKPRLGL